MEDTGIHQKGPHERVQTHVMCAMRALLGSCGSANLQVCVDCIVDPLGRVMRRGFDVSAFD